MSGNHHSSSYFTILSEQLPSEDTLSGESEHTCFVEVHYPPTSNSDAPVVGFYDVGSESSSHWKPHVLTFKDISRGAARIAETVSEHLVAEQGQTVALLCPSSADSLFHVAGTYPAGPPGASCGATVLAVCGCAFMQITD